MLQIIQSQAVPIPRRDIDTDLIIPAEFLTGTVKTGLGKHLFDRVRQSDKDFKALQSYSDARIIVTRENFGCGSSREHAAWALYDWGVRVVIAPGFADIFKSNAMKNGIVPVVLPFGVVERILTDAQAEENYVVTVNLPEQKVILPDGSVYAFEIDPYRKTCLMEGVDDLGYLLSRKLEIEAYDEKRAGTLFFDVSKV